jgi:hypothetical protein
MLIVSSAVFATTQDSLGLARCVAALNNALINKDTVALKRLLRDDVHYYHSNGWVELKKDMIKDLYDGTITYKQINVVSQSIQVSGNMGQARMNIDVDVVMHGKPLQFKLDVYQHWVWNNYEWKMVARKSQKV